MDKEAMDLYNKVIKVVNDARPIDIGHVVDALGAAIAESTRELSQEKRLQMIHFLGDAIGQAHKSEARPSDTTH